MRNVFNRLVCAALVAMGSVAVKPTSGAAIFVTSTFTGTNAPYSFTGSGALGSPDFSITKSSGAGSISPGPTGATIGPIGAGFGLRVTLAAPGTAVGMTTVGSFGGSLNLTSITLNNGDTYTGPTSFVVSPSGFFGVSDTTPFTVATFNFTPVNANSTTLTDFRFVTASVPEPVSAGMLGAVAAGGLLARRRSRSA